MLLEADSLSRAERQQHTCDLRAQVQPEEVGNLQALHLLYQVCRRPPPSTTPPPLLPPPNNNTWPLSTLTTHLHCQEGDPELKETRLSSLRSLLSRGTDSYNPTGSRPQPTSPALSLITTPSPMPASSCTKCPCSSGCPPQPEPLPLARPHPWPEALFFHS